VVGSAQAEFRAAYAQTKLNFIVYSPNIPLFSFFMFTLKITLIRLTAERCETVSG
jgi:hypothetical protein